MGALRLKAHLVFVDESGFMLTPTVVRTWEPRGRTPIFRHSQRHDRISVISGISVSPTRRRVGLYYRWHHHNIREIEAVAFLRHPLRHLRGDVVLIWNNTPTILGAGWDELTQVRRELPFTAGRVIVRGKVAARGKKKRADYLLSYQINLPLSVVEAKDNTQAVGAGLQQGLGYAETLDVPFVFSSNGDGFLFHDRTGLSTPVEKALKLEEFPAPAELWSRFRAWKGITNDTDKVVRFPYYEDASGRELRDYLRIAVQHTIEAVARGQRRILLAMSTGAGKTYTAFWISWRLWKAGVMKRALSS